MRRVYETDEHRAAEREMARRLALAWKCEAVKRPALDRIDWTLTARSGRVTRALMECKNRPRYDWATLDRLGGVFISEQKWQAARDECVEQNLPFVVLVQPSDQTLWWHRADWSHDGVVVGGRSDRDDPKDIERCITLRRARFAPVVEPVSGMTDKDINWGWST